MSSWAHGEGDGNGNRRLGASIHIFDTYPDPFNWSEIQENTFCQETTIITDDHPSVPVYHTLPRYARTYRWPVQLSRSVAS